MTRTDTELANVMFRRERLDSERDSEVIAVFVDQVNPVTGMVGCYQHAGQHGSCSRAWVERTRPASPEEYADLLRELERIGYAVTIRHRFSA